MKQGSEIKLAITAELPAPYLLSPDPTYGVDFYVDFFCSRDKLQRIQKADMEWDATDELYYALVDTTLTGAGILKFNLTCFIPDSLAPDGLRTEITDDTPVMKLERIT